MMLWWGSVPALGVSALSGLVGWLVWGVPEGTSVLGGGVLALVVFALGVAAIRGLLSGPNRAVMAGAFAVLLLQMALIAGLLLLVVRLDQVSLPAFGAGFLMGGLAFQAGSVAAALRARVTVEPEAAGASASVAPDQKETR